MARSFMVAGKLFYLEKGIKVINAFGDPKRIVSRRRREVKSEK
jgi:hypothetical protein